MKVKNKVLVKVIVPEIDSSYDIFIPVNEIIWKVKRLILKSIKDLTSIIIVFKISDKKIQKLFRFRGAFFRRGRRVAEPVEPNEEDAFGTRLLFPIRQVVERILGKPQPVDVALVGKEFVVRSLAFGDALRDRLRGIG